MKKIKKLAYFCGVFFLLVGTTAQAFEQDYTPTDPGLIYQTYFDMINIEPSWSDDLEVNKEVIVAVLDSGVDLDHPDLRDNIWTNSGEIPGDGIDNDENSFIDDVHGWDFINSDSNPEPDLVEGYDYTALNHGTVISGIISATMNNRGIVGVAPQAKIMPLKILDHKGVGNTLVLSQAIEYASENGADVINLSLVGDFYDETLQKAIKNAYNNGVMIVAASGNETNVGVSLDIEPRYPVCDIDAINRVLGVAAVDADKKLAGFSNFGETCIDISAPGTSFYSTTYYNQDANELMSFYQGGWNGTSVATPLVSATAALIKMQYPELRPYDIYSILTASADDLSKANPEHHVDLGSGLLNIGGALELATIYQSDSTKILLAPEAGLPPEIKVMDTEGNLETSFMAYVEHFKGGVNMAVGDIDGDGYNEIVTAPMAGGGPHIKIFNSHGALIKEFFAYGAGFTGGVNLAVGDVNGDGKDEIVTAPMSAGGPHVRVFNHLGHAISQFFAYDKDFRGGVNLAVGDVTNNGKAEIITAPASGHKPEIRVFDHKRRVKGSFLAYDAGMTKGVKLTVGDVNSDHWNEIITTPGRGVSPQIRLFSSKGRQKGEFQAYSQYLYNGIDILARDISGDRLPEIIALPGKGSAALMKVYDYDGKEKDTFYLRDFRDKNGYNFEIFITK